MQSQSLQAAGADGKPVVFMSPLEFHSSTKQKRNRLQLKSGSFGEGTTSSYQLQQAGLANEIYGSIQVQVVVAGTVTGGKWAGSSASGTSSPTSTNGAPFGVMKQMRFYNTASYMLRQLDGISWYQWMRDRYGFDPSSMSNGAYFSDQDVEKFVLGGNTQSGTIKPGANIAAGTYQLVIPFRLPLSYNHAGDRALIVLGTENLFYNLDIDWGTIATGIGATGGSSDLIKGLTGSGLSVTVGTATINFELEYYMLPNNAIDAQGRSRLGSFTNSYMSVIQQNQTITATGQQTFLPPPNAVYTGIGIQLYNAGAPIPSASVTNVSWQFGGQVTDVIDDLRSMQARQAWLSQNVPMDGRIFFDLGVELGIYQKRDEFGAFNNQSVTGLQIQWNIDSSVSLSGGLAVAVLESMQPFKQAA